MVDYSLFPEVPLTQEARVIYVRGIDQPTHKELIQKNYRPVDLMTLPRGSGDEEVKYLFAKLQAYDEGTIPFTEEDRKVLELALRANGCLNPKSMRLNINANIDDKTVDKLLNWGPSRHTLRGSSTVQDAQFSLEDKEPG